MPGRGAAGRGSMTGPHCRCRDAIRTTELRPPGIGKNTFGSREDLRRGAWRRVSSGRWRTRVGAVHANARRRCGQTPAARHGLRAPASGFGIGAVSSVGDVGADAAPLGRHPGGKPQRAGGGRYGAIGIVALGERDAAGARARGGDGAGRPVKAGCGRARWRQRGPLAGVQARAQECRQPRRALAMACMGAAHRAKKAPREGREQDGELNIHQSA